MARFLLYFFSAAFVLYLIIVILSPLYFTKGCFKRFYHDFMHWHIPDENQIFDGVNRRSICKHCKKEILQDSQGNWFITECYKEE